MARDDVPEGGGFVIDKKRQKASAPDKRKRSAAQALSRERELERLVFGEDAELAAGFGREGGDEEDDDDGRDSGDDEGEAGHGGAGAHHRGPGRAAWEDDDDEQLAVDVSAAPRTRKLRRNVDETLVRGRDYEQRLRERFSQTYGNVAWARRRAPGGADDDAGAGSGEDADADGGGGGSDALSAALRSTKPLVRKEGLSPTELRVSRATDANAAERSSAVVQAIDFHPSSRLFLTAGLDRTLRLFRLDGADNPKLQGVFFKDLPLTGAKFSADGQQVVVCGRGRHLFALDLPSSTVVRVPPFVAGPAAGGAAGAGGGGKGKGGAKAYDQLALSPDGEWLALSAAGSGTILLLAARSKQLVGTLRMNRPGASLAFSGGGSGGGGGLLCSGSQAGEMYLWDVRSSRCACRFRDEGLSDTTALAADAAGRTLAVGSAAGIVNVYARDGLLASDGPARPLKAIGNLTTAVSSLAFSHDGALLALASRAKRNALRIAHVPSLRVYANWPTAKTPLRHAQCVAFHPRGAYFAAGNDRGHVLLYRLEAYADV